MVLEATVLHEGKVFLIESGNEIALGAQLSCEHVEQDVSSRLACNDRLCARVCQLFLESVDVSKR